MSDKRKPIHLVIDGNKMETRIEKGEVNVVQFDPEMIKNFNIAVALNGGFSVTLTYHDSSKQDVLVFQNSAELISALSKLVKN